MTSWMPEDEWRGWRHVLKEAVVIVVLLAAFFLIAWLENR